jgi:hypothetical protein
MKTLISSVVMIAVAAMTFPFAAIAQHEGTAGPGGQGMKCGAQAAVAPETMEKFKKETKDLQIQLID